MAEDERGLVLVARQLLTHEGELIGAEHAVVTTTADLVVGVETEQPQPEDVVGEPGRAGRAERVTEAVVLAIGSGHGRAAGRRGAGVRAVMVASSHEVLTAVRAEGVEVLLS